MLRLAGPAAVVAVGVLLLGWSWMKWPDPLVDFGQQLYLPWQLAAGKRLYVDLSYFHGPLAQYVNALAFRLLGTSLWTIVNVNVIVLAALVVALYGLLRQVAGRFGVAAAGVVFMVVFAFAQYTEVGNYNYMTPYEHSATWGMLTSITGLFLLGRFLDDGRWANLVASGVCLGLCFLTKAEIFLAAAAAQAVGLGLAMWARRAGGRRALKLVGVVAGAAVLPVVAAFGLLMVAGLPAGDALLGTLGPWPAVIEGKVVGLRFYRVVMGTDDVGRSIVKLLASTGCYVAVFAPAAAVALAVRAPGRRALLVAAASFAVGLGVLALLLPRIPWLEAARPLPLVMVVAAVAELIALARARRQEMVDAMRIMRPTLVVFAFVLLFKILLNTRVYHYGFVLAMPATLLLVVILVDWIPARITGAGGRGPIFAAVSAAVLLAALVGHLRLTNAHYRLKTYPVAEGADGFWAGIRGAAVDLALEAIEKHVGPRQTLAVLPEGVMLNYLSRRVNPTPYTNFLPPVLLIHPEADIVGAFEDNPPDFVMLVHKDSSEFGPRFFGRDYGLEIGAWIEANYEPVELIGDPPLQDDRFGMLLLRRVP